MTDAAERARRAPRARRLREHGFSLVELMVAVVVGLLGVLAIMSVFVQSEAQKRATTGGADASENALIALVTMERDLRMAGIGMVGLGCTTVSAYNANLSPTDFSFAPLPLEITRGTVSDAVGAAVASDTITLVYSASPFGNIPTTLAAPLPTSLSTLTVANGDGVLQGNVILISEGSKTCTLLQASANSALSGATWDIPHAAAPAFPFNRATDLFEGSVPGGYSTGARVTNMGAMVRRAYFVQNGSLMMQDLNLPVTSPTNPVALVGGVVAMQARYGLDTSGDGYLDEYTTTPPAATNAGSLVAVEIAVVARGGQLEKTAVSPATLVLWRDGTTKDGGAITLDANQQRYRYKVYKTIVPLRNVIWGNNP